MNYIFKILLFTPALLVCGNLIKTYYCLRKKYREEKLYYERHNCVVTYAKDSIRGWPPNYNIKITKNNLSSILEPYFYFIKNAKFSIDIAIMRIAINPLFEVLLEAVNKGVRVRLIVNYLSVVSMRSQFKKLISLGIEVAFYVDKSDQLNNIMHCKYLIKDYQKNDGYLCIGSLNLTSISTMLNNYEDVAFTSDVNLVENFHNRFEESWRLINTDNEKEYNKSVLRDSGFL